MQKRIDIDVSSANWDDWRLVDAVATAGTTAGAAKLLNVNQSTVFRRISALEEQLGVRLFDRDRRGYSLTTEGEAILPDVQMLGEVALRIERRIDGYDQRAEGEVRLSLNATIARFLLPDILSEFRQSYPNIRVELLITDRLISIADREADLVIRGSNDPDPDLHGRRLLRLHYSVYCSEMVADIDGIKDQFVEAPKSLEWILYGGRLLETAPGNWIRENLSGVAPGIVATDVETMAYLSRAGGGVCLLPRFLGDRIDGLVSISPNIEGLFTELWVLTHKDLRKTVRVSALLRFIASKLTQADETPHVLGRRKLV